MRCTSLACPPLQFVAPKLIEAEEASEAAAATLVALDAEDPDCLEAVSDAIGDAPPEILDGVRSALRHCRIEPLVPRLLAIVEHGSSAHAAAAVDVLAFQRRALPRRAMVLLADEDSAVRTLAIRALARVGEAPTSDGFDRALASPEPAERRAALEAAARTGLSDLAVRCRRAVEVDCPGRHDRIAWLGVVGSEADEAALLSILRGGDASLVASALRGLAALGMNSTVPPLIDRLDDPEFGIDAARAFARITGIVGIGEDADPDPEDPEADRRADAERAAEEWGRRSAAVARRSRWQCGVAVDGPGGIAFDQLGLAARRDAFFGCRARGGLDVDLELERLAVLQGEPAAFD